ncbi:hypothetical protein D3C75_887810 [compost metagenome]
MVALQVRSGKSWHALAGSHHYQMRWQIMKQFIQATDNSFILQMMQVIEHQRERLSQAFKVADNG